MTISIRPRLHLVVVAYCAAMLVSFFCVLRPIGAFPFAAAPPSVGAVQHQRSAAASARGRGRTVRGRRSRSDSAQSSSTSSPVVALKAWNSSSNQKNPFGSLLGRADKIASTRQQLLDLLLDECGTKNSEKNKKKKKPDRNAIELLIDQLQVQSPVTATAASPKLQKRWKLVYTTEKEINFFLDAGLATEIYQTIDGATLRNAIPFVKGGGSFCVQGTLSVPDPRGARTEFEFTAATLNLGQRWGEYQLPPVGRGWFDTVYLDDRWRIDRNSRNDLLICQVASAAAA